MTVALANAFDITSPHPNPFAHQAEFTLTVQQAQPVTVALYDVMGRRVGTVFSGTVAAGTPQPITLRAYHLPSGRYLVRIEGQTFQATREVVVIR
jgi:hypothetical protein